MRIEVDISGTARGMMIMTLPRQIPTGARVVVRVTEGPWIPTDHRMKFRDYVGHVVSWDGYTLELVRDAAANGSRPAQT